MKYKVYNEHTVDYRLNPSSSCFTNNFPSTCHNKRKKKGLKPFHIEYKVSTFLDSNLTHKKPRTVADYRLSTVRLKVKTLLPCILLLTPAIEDWGHLYIT